ERLVEATGGEYSVAGRMSSWTGIPSILGWQGHEKQWGRDDRTLAVRANAVKTIYESTSLDDALPILQQYGVTYVVVGSVERATYPAAGLQKFDNGLVSAFTVGSTTIYRMPPTLENTGIEGARAGEAAP
ncbi:MAG TPA: hypothetical protein VFX19_00680, partial [Dehalococcoidia bacterium]|nr:hypothetical protein [Dehalococcoidia bacterium]